MIFEKSVETLKPLGLESIMANTILDYVIDHPGEDPLTAYNSWVESVAIHRHFPVNEQSMAIFALKQFETYYTKCSRESLLMCQQIERDMAQVESRDLAKHLAKRSGE